MAIHLKHLIALIVVIAACSPESETRTNAIEPSGVLTFIHLNDTYRIDAVEEGRAGGFGRVVTLIRELQGKGNEVRVLHAGDFLFPSLESQLWAGEQMIDALNFIDDVAPMYVIPGNHELDRRTPEVIINAVRQSRFDWLGDNISFNTGDQEADQRLKSGFVFEVLGRKIGIVSLTAHEKDSGNQREYAPIDRDYLGVARQVLADLDAQNVELIIGLTHLYLRTDKEIAKLKEDHPRLLFIVGGHDHEPEHEPGTPESAEVMKGASNARTVWQIDVRFPDDGGIPEIVTKAIRIDETIESDPEYDALTAMWRNKLLETIPFLPARIGSAALPLDGREETVRNRESNWGNFIVDQMRTAFGEPAADFAFINSGTLRIDDFVAEDVTFEDVGRTFGFSSFLRHLKLSGADFVTLLEAGYRGGTGSQGYFPQVSGFRICVDQGRPEGDRIVQLQEQIEGSWIDLQPDRVYMVVTSDFLYGGGDGYDFSNAREVSRAGSELKYLVLDAIIRAQAAGQAIGEPVDPSNRRIFMLNEDGDSCFESNVN